MNRRLMALFLGGALVIGIGTLAAPAELIVKQTPASAPAPPATQPAHSFAPKPQVNYAVTQTLEVGGEGLWNSMTLDAAGKFLYIPRTTHTQVIDTATGKIVADIGPCRSAANVALVPEFGRGFITSPVDATLTIFDLKTNAILGTILVGHAPGLMVYDAPSKRLFVACSEGTLVPVAPNLDPKTGKPDTAIVFDGDIKGLVSDGQGMVYATVESRDEVEVLDTRTMKIPVSWPLGEWHGPGAITMDHVHGRLVVSYHANVAIMSAADGHVMGEILLRPTPSWQFPASMAEYYDGHVFSACGDGTMTILGQNADGHFEVHQMLALEANAHPLAIDQTTGKIYLPSMKMEKNKPVPGSFKIQVVEKKPL